MVESEMDRSAEWFQEEVMELLPDLLGAARSMGTTGADSEDAVAEAVALAWERLDDLREKVRFRGWIFRILRNCCLGRIRKARSRPETVSLDKEGNEGSFSLFERLHQPFLLWWSNPEMTFLDALLEDDIRQALESLPEEYRTVVLLADVHEFRYAEIAEALDIPIGTVRSRLARGRSRMQEALWRHAVDRGLRKPRSTSGNNPT